MDVGMALVERARAIGRSGIAVVGTAKNVGKTTTTAEVYAALHRADTAVGITSIGRDGEGVDILEATAKHRLFLHAGTLIATARTLLRKHPAVEIVEHTKEQSALGSILLVRIRTPDFYEIAGPPGADALHRVVRLLRSHGASFVLLDGAVDRIAALRGGEEAIITATGAAGTGTFARIVEEVAGLVAKLSLPLVDLERPFMRITGALHAGEASLLAHAGERRQILLHDPTRLTFGGGLFLTLAGHLDFRCEHTLHPVAVTVSSMSSRRSFDPQDFLRAVAEATALPTYDVCARAAA
jgi:hypothetical protein